MSDSFDVLLPYMLHPYAKNKALVRSLFPSFPKLGVAKRTYLRESMKNKIDSDLSTALAYMSYKIYLQTTYWAIIRAIMVSRKKGRCNICRYNNKTVHVHHLTYEHRGKEFAYLGDLRVLCKDCHYKIHHEEESYGKGGLGQLRKHTEDKAGRICVVCGEVKPFGSYLKSRHPKNICTPCRNA